MKKLYTISFFISAFYVFFRDTSVNISGQNIFKNVTWHHLRPILLVCGNGGFAKFLGNNGITRMALGRAHLPPTKVLLLLLLLNKKIMSGVSFVFRRLSK